MKTDITFRALLLFALGIIPNTAAASNQDPATNPQSSSDGAILPQAAQDIEKHLRSSGDALAGHAENQHPQSLRDHTGRRRLDNPYVLTNAAYWGGPWAHIGLLARGSRSTRGPTDQLPARRWRGTYGEPKSGLRRRVCSWPHGGLAGGGSASRGSRHPSGCESVRSCRATAGGRAGLAKGTV